MYGDSWTCLLVHNGPGILPDKLCAALKKAACELYLKRRDRMQMVNDLCEGVLQTDWNTQLVGTRSGILFRSQFDWKRGGCKVNFLLSTEDLKKGADTLRQMMETESGEWLDSPEPFPVPELYRFYDLRGH